MNEALPPSDNAAEISLLASLVICEGNQEVWSTVMAAVRPTTFYLADNGIIYSALAAMRSQGQDIDGVTLRGELARRGKLEDIGGLPYLAKMLDVVPSWHHWQTYLKTVIDTHQRRQLIALAESLQAKAYLPAADARAIDIAADAQKLLANIIESGTGGRYERLDTLAIEAFEDLEKKTLTLIPSGFTALDEVIGGFGEGEFWLLGARPSMGKSTLIRQILVHLGRRQIPVGFISLEEGRLKVGRNTLSMESGVDNHKIRSKDLAQGDYNKLAEGLRRIDGLPVFVSTTARRLVDIAAIAAILQAREGIKLLVIDYLQRIGGARGQTRFEQVTEISLAISELAKTLNLAILCPVQLSRKSEEREDKRPEMADIRESGQLEQDADGIIFLHRDDFYRTRAGLAERDGIAELIIAKQRDGIRGVTVKLKSEVHYQRFGEFTDEPTMYPGVEATT